MQGSSAGFELEFERVRVGKRKRKRVTDACIARIPYVLYSEILQVCQLGRALIDIDREGVDFTADSPAESSDAPEMSPPAPAPVETSSSEIEPSETG